MEVVLAFVVGSLYAGGIYLLMRRHMIKWIIGLVLLSHAANLLIFIAASLTRAHAPIISEENSRLIPPYADPLPQALILTAIVISFGVLAFALVLSHRAIQTIHSEDIDTLRTTDQQ